MSHNPRPPSGLMELSGVLSRPSSGGAPLEAPVDLSTYAETSLLPSEVLSQGHFPALLTSQDLRNITVVLLLYLPTIAFLGFAGAAGLLYWLLAFATFLVPFAVVTSKLAKMFPREGAFYVWINKALGPFWDSLLGFFCLWWPPVLASGAVGSILIALLQSIGKNFGQSWLTDSTVQGILSLAFILVVYAIANLPLDRLRQLIKGAVLLLLGIIGVLALATVAWLLAGNTPQISFSLDHLSPQPSTLVVYSAAILGCLGLQLPLNMAAEVREPGAVSGYLRPSVLLVIAGYLLGWFALVVILPQNPTDPSNIANPGNTGQVFAVAFGGAALGRGISALISVCLCVFFLISNATYMLVQSRLLVVSALDLRLPRAFARISSSGVPRVALFWQMVILVAFTVVFFVLLPGIAPNGDFGTILFALIPAASQVLWSISSLALFLAAWILVRRYRVLANAVGGASSGTIILVSIIGAAAALAGIVLVFSSPATSLLPLRFWIFWVFLVVLFFLAVGAVYSSLAPEPADGWMRFDRALREGAPGKEMRGS